MRSSSSPFSRIALLLAGVLMAHLGAALPASALRVCTYNVENWPEDSATRTAYFRTIMAEVEPDVIVLQEVESQLGVNQFLLNVLDYVAPGEYWMMPFVNGPDTDNACYYKIAVVDSIFHEQIDTPVRQTSVYRFRLDGYQASEAEFTILSTHLKAGIDPSDEQDRLDMTTVIREYLNDYPPNSHFMVAGDFNLRTSSEASYQMLVGYQADNDGRSKDPINSGGYWHDNSSFRYIHSQSTRLDWGGMDDRYDFILVSYALDDGEGLSYVDGSYVTFGNDGLRLNLAINDPPNQVVSAEVADALHDASDHVPVYLEIQVPAKVEAATSLEFGTVIVGAPAPCETLTVTNAASAPADELEYGLTAPAGFSAPTGSFILGSGQSFDHAITMETASAGAKSGDLVIDSNDVDSPSWNVALSGTVLDHASPSLVESGIVLEDTLDFGAAAPGTHGSQMLPVYNEGYDDLQALLEVYDAEIVGGDGRFSFVGGFTAKTAGSDPAEYEIAFDSGTAEWDTTYEATLTFSTRDEQGIPGAANLDDLIVHLRAYVGVGAEVAEEDVLKLDLSRGAPNPFASQTTLVLSLPDASEVDVAVYDVSGRLVRTLAEGTLAAGRHVLSWDGRDDAGAEVASGIYFCRAEVGTWRQSSKVVLLR